VRTASDAYLPIFFPIVIISLALLFDQIINYAKISVIAILIVVSLAGINSYSLLKNNYLMQEKGNGPTFTQRIDAARQIIKQAGSQSYNIVSKGSGRQPIMNYVYLTWWMGHAPSEKPQKLKFIMSENLKTISIKKEDK
jgi:hypothetical protein